MELTTLIKATLEAELRRTPVQCQPRHKWETLIEKQLKQKLLGA
jgi:hypothetical protein